MVTAALGRIEWFLSLSLIVPTALDGLIQMFSKRESTNVHRFITGVMAGVGILCLIALGFVLAFQIGYQFAKYVLIN